MMTEQGVLRISIAMTLVVAAFGIVFGLLSGSFAIVFDGIYAMTDAIMTVVALFVSRLIAAAAGPAQGRLMDRFTVGFWHLEPMVLALNGLMLMTAAIYALVNAIGSLMSGGRDLAFGEAIAYAVFTLAITISMALFARRANRTIGSELVALDVKAWIMSASLTAALLIAFLIGALVQGTSLEWISPYIDPAVLILVSLVIIPMPISTVWHALADILLVTPAELKAQVDRVAEATVARHGFLTYRAYVAKVGRGRQIELYFIVPGGWPPRPLEAWDALRDEIGAELGEASPDRWLTIVFTTDLEWAE
ncbi:cation diffusion facilitator family transporter [Rhizobium rhizosphaerae]|uniref:Cation diffusion facilitator family transporter n=2 Tax=Xaviernesmea rhizosphaerae TaxID=1672749 RepID=A0A1Q9AKC0_9HYPH|nr:cation transporter [Xaviernesmea rhizosphaerae]OLP55717.1 cation diffusion facilitator family transporter [Xaviernesmea rhizosphaerae]